MVDFNGEPTDALWKISVRSTNLIQEKTYFKNPVNQACIALTMTNRPKPFNESEAIETGLSDFCKISLTVMKVFYIKQKPKFIHYKNYKDFSNEDFMHELEITLSSFFQI